MALAILVIVLGVLLKGLTQGARNAAYLEDRTIAHWVAANIVAEYQLGGQSGGNGSTFGAEQGETTMAGRSWYWTTRIVTTDDPDLRRIEVEVRSGGRDGPVLDTLISYVARPFHEMTR
uniref:Type II secretion system protein I n=1 Tax=Candidatus Kentrum sp. DK TaxID=2126562 RepID=A0A450S6N8_9GAMM|nr:MAG: type II secretion system protein I (GspI) [Candidatus Kentron sp. DK]VFJ63444.1 MAG: type II secretion system protein I (GspI) [Candidatus Kentron sp. DK]